MRLKGVSRAAVAAGIGTLAAIAFASPEPAPGPAAPAPSPLAHGPIATYDTACARCHGPNGSFYGPTLGKGKTDAQLRQVIKEMAEGPSQLPPLPAVELEAQTAYHRALIKGEPFVALTLRTKTRIEGEVTSGSTITVTQSGKTTAAKIDGSRWSAPLAAKSAAPTIMARLGKTSTMLNIGTAAFSHGAPLAETGQAK